MAQSWTVTQTLRIGNNTLSTAVAKTADGSFIFDDAISANQTNKLIACSVDVSQVVAIYISSDEDCILETNNSGTPAQTLNIDADNPLVWTKDSGITNPLTTDITALYVTNTTAITRLAIYILVDLTV